MSLLSAQVCDTPGLTLRRQCFRRVLTVCVFPSSSVQHGGSGVQSSRHAFSNRPQSAATISGLLATANTAALTSNAPYIPQRHLGSSSEQYEALYTDPSPVQYSNQQHLQQQQHQQHQQPRSKLDKHSGASNHSVHAPAAALPRSGRKRAQASDAELTTFIKGCSTADELAAVVDMCADHMNVVHLTAVATVLTSLATRGNIGQRQWRQHPKVRAADVLHQMQVCTVGSSPSTECTSLSTTITLPSLCFWS